MTQNFIEQTPPENTKDSETPKSEWEKELEKESPRLVFNSLDKGVNTISIIWLKTFIRNLLQQQIQEDIERIICSAVRFQGKVWMGHRHGNAIEAMHSELSYVMNRRQMNEQQTDRDQGFVTSNGRYVDRAEAWGIAEKAGQIIKREYQTKDCLYSEDVW